MGICCIYKITSPTGRIYIGSTKNYKKRILTYKNYRCKEQRKLYNSLRKHGYHNHQFEIVIECVESDLFKYERMYGDLYDVLNEKNLNLCLPGYDEVKGIISEETKAKMSVANKGRKMSEETKAKLREVLKGKIISEEHRLKIGLIWKGKKRSEETKRRMSASRKGKRHSDETKARMRASLKGRKLLKQTKAKISLANKLRKVSEETKAKLRGRVISEETKAKLRTANKGRKISEEQKQKTRSTLKQKKLLKIKEKQVLKQTKSKLYPLRTNYLFMCNQTGIFYTIKDISRIFKISVNVIKYYVITNQLHKIPYQLV